MRVHPVAESFRSVAEVYERARPGYPAAAVEHLQTRLGLRAGRVVLDLGAGTGKLTRSLLATGAHVIAVEPLAEMRETLTRLIPEAESVEGVAEALPFPPACVDAVTVGQAFHWFAAGPAFQEIARVLRPGGALALVWNRRNLDDPLQRSLEEMMLPYRGATPSARDERWRATLRDLPVFGPEERQSFRWEMPLTADLLADRIVSTSFVAELDSDTRDRLLAAVRQLVAGWPEPFPFSYSTDVNVFPRSRAS
jgi:SAM-dependent methyltransferase